MRLVTQSILNNIDNIKECFRVLGFDFNLDSNENNRFPFSMYDTKKGRITGLYGKIFYYEDEQDFDIDFSSENLDFEVVHYRKKYNELADSTTDSLFLKEWGQTGLYRAINITRTDDKVTSLLAGTYINGAPAPTDIHITENSIEVTAKDTGSFKCDKTKTYSFGYDKDGFRGDNPSKVIPNFEEIFNENMMGCVDFIEENFPLYGEIKKQSIKNKELVNNLD